MKWAGWEEPGSMGWWWRKKKGEFLGDHRGSGCKKDGYSNCADHKRFMWMEKENRLQYLKKWVGCDRSTNILYWDGFRENRYFCMNVEKYKICIEKRKRDSM